MPILTAVIYSYLLLYSLPLYEETTTYPSFLLIAVQFFWSDNTLLCTSRVAHGVYKLVHRVFSCSVLLGNSKLFARMIVPVYTLTISV